MGVVGNKDWGWRKLRSESNFFFHLREKRETCVGGRELSPDQFRTYDYFIHSKKKKNRIEKIVKKKDEHVALVFNLYQKKKK